METVIAANRFGLGARPGDLPAIGNDYQGWLLAQVDGPAALPRIIADLPPSADVLAEFQSMRQDMMKQRQTAAAADKPSPDVVNKARNILGPAYRDQLMARYTVAAGTEQPFRERLVHFWSNHFAVSADKPTVTALAGGLENEAIRPHVSGYFADMLLAVEQHPAMLLYLDNQASIGPNSKAAQRMQRFGRGRRKADINENLGREILELHTLGVDGGYSQADVTNFSKVLTGWSVGGGPGRLRQGQPGQFVFRSVIHEPGKQTVLAKAYKENGIRQGEAVLHDLARHPATARHLATKLARHFIADEPPATAVDRLASAYLKSDGYLPAVYAALVESPEAWDNILAKYKTPSDFVISSLRALSVTPDQPQQLIGSLMLMGQPGYRPGSPAGWGDTAADWDGADGLMKRIEWATAVGYRAGNFVDPPRLAENVLGSALSEHSGTWIRRAETRAQGLTLLLVSPEFQRR